MDWIHPIGPPGSETHPVERVTQRDLDEEEAGRRDEQRRERKRKATDPADEVQPQVEPVLDDDEDDDHPHVDVRA
jgi:hypothetical protein